MVEQRNMTSFFLKNKKHCTCSTEKDNFSSKSAQKVFNKVCVHIYFHGKNWKKMKLWCIVSGFVPKLLKMEHETEFVYVLLCQQDKYYVGISKDPEERLRQHSDLEDLAKGAAWTKVYPPVRMFHIEKASSRFDEDKVTKMCMATYGIDNVRGGAYCRLDLSKYERMLILHEIKNANRVCYNCDAKTHLAKDCPHPKVDPWANYRREEKKTGPPESNRPNVYQEAELRKKKEGLLAPPVINTDPPKPVMKHGGITVFPT